MSILLILYNLLYVLLYLPMLTMGYVIARLAGHGAHYFQRLGFGMPAGKSPSVWFHAASVGEVRSLKLIIDSLRKTKPNHNIIVSVITQNGYDCAEAELKADSVFMLPIENMPALRSVVKKNNVKVFCVTDTEIWPNLIYALKNIVHMVMLNARISDKTFKTYKKFKFIFSPLIGAYKYIFVKSEDDGKKFLSLSEKAQVVVGGNIKYSAVPAKVNEAILKRFDDKKFAIAASTHPSEEKIFLQGTKDWTDAIVIAPRHISRAKEVKELAVSLGCNASLLSENKDTHLIVVDKLGLLETFYRCASKIFVGGSLNSTGGHNIYEALKYSKTVAVGPNMSNFADIAALGTEYNLLTTVRNSADIATWLTANDEKPDFAGFKNALEKEHTENLKILLEYLNRCIG